MVIYHAFYDMWSFNLFSDTKIALLANEFFATPFYSALWLFAVSIFFIIAGITSNFSKSNLKRSVYCLGAAFLITIATVLFAKGNEIYFGVLHCFGFCIFIYFLIKRFFLKTFKKIPSYIFFILFVGYYIFTELLPATDPIVIKIFSFSLYVPIFVIGIIQKGFFSADFFPLFPWLFLFLFGAKTGEIIKEGKLPKWFYESDIPILSFLGKYPFAVYVLHQPIILGILFLLDKILK